MKFCGVTIPLGMCICICVGLIGIGLLILIVASIEEEQVDEVKQKKLEQFNRILWIVLLTAVLSAIATVTLLYLSNMLVAPKWLV